MAVGETLKNVQGASGLIIPLVLWDQVGDGSQLLNYFKLKSTPADASEGGAIGPGFRGLIAKDSGGLLKFLPIGSGGGLVIEDGASVDAAVSGGEVGLLAGNNTIGSTLNAGYAGSPSFLSIARNLTSVTDLEVIAATASKSIKIVSCTISADTAGEYILYEGSSGKEVIGHHLSASQPVPYYDGTHHKTLAVGDSLRIKKGGSAGIARVNIVWEVV